MPKEKRAAEGEMVGCHPNSVDMSLSKLWEIVKDRKTWHAAVHGILNELLHDLATEQQCFFM